MGKYCCKWFEKVIDVFPFAVLCAIMTYAVFWGVGNPVSVGGLSIWTMLLVLFLLSAGISVLRNLHYVLRNPYLWMLILFGVWVVFSTAYGIVKGNDIGLVMRDISGVVYFAFFPLLFVVLKNQERVHLVMKFMMYSALALSAMLTVLVGAYVLVPEMFGIANNYFIKINYLNFTRISATIPRLLFVSMPFQVAGCAFSIYFQTIQEKFNFTYACITGFCLCAIVMTFTRALYLSAAIAGTCIVTTYLVSLKKEKRKMLAIQLVTSVSICVLVIGLLSLIAKTNYLDYALKRALIGVSSVEEPTESTLSPSLDPTDSPQSTEVEPEENQDAEDYLIATAASDQYRVAIKKELMDWIKKSPVIGNGMGLALNLKEDWPEYSYLDLMAKTGIVGMLLYFTPILLMAIAIFKDLIHGKEAFLSVAWLVVMMGLMSYSIFQPYLNNVQCVLVYCCTLCVHGVGRSSERNESEQNGLSVKRVMI